LDIRHGSEKILVIDDEPMVCTLVQDILKRHGYTGLIAQEGEEAVDIYRQQSAEIAAVILDMVMPGDTGREVFNKLRMINPGVKVIVASGYNKDRDADDLMEQGAAAFIQKPYRINELMKIIGDVVGGNG